MAFNTTYDLVTNREDLSNQLIKKGDNTALLLSSLEKVRKAKVTNIKHEWSEFTIRAGAANAQVENFTPTIASVVPSKVNNYLQIYQTAFGISNTQLDTPTVAGIRDQFAWTAEQQFTALRKDINYALIENTVAVTGPVGTAREMQGMFGAITSNTSTPAASTSVIVESDLIALVRKIVDATGETRNLVCHTGSKTIERITAFTGLGKTQFVTDESDKHNIKVNIIITNFGNIKLITDGQVGNTRLGLFDFSTWALAYARTPKLKRLPEATDGRSAYWVTELTLEYLYEAANAKMTNLANT